VNHPLTILTTLDSFLEQETRVVLYGRAALALGFGAAAETHGATMDVDAILPAVEMAAVEADAQFWRALDRTNAALESRGLYMTHLFTDEQVILTPEWLEKIVPLPVPGLTRLRVSRLSTVDLVLTKMMRRDPQDADDIELLLREERIGPKELAAAFARARCPEISEIRETFVALQPVVLAVTRRIANAGARWR
jgi:hypothetical protein